MYARLWKEKDDEAKDDAITRARAEHGTVAGEFRPGGAGATAEEETRRRHGRPHPGHGPGAPRHGDGGGGTDTITVRFGWKQFVGGNCTALMGGAVCRHAVVSEGTSMPLTLGPDEAASLDVPGSGAGVQV